MKAVTPKLLVILFVFFAGPPTDGRGTEIMPDFALPDVNDTSSTFAQSVSPRDYLGQVSGWYFGKAT